MTTRPTHACIAILLLVASLTATAEGADRRVVSQQLIGVPGSRHPFRRVVVSPDGKHVAWTAKVKGGEAVFVDGKAGRAYAEILDPWPSNAAQPPAGIFFSPKGGHVAYAARAGKKKRMVVDGRKGRTYDDLQMPVFSSDGKRFAYAARRAGKWLVVVDGREGKRYDAVAYPSYRYGGPFFNRDGTRVAYCAKEDGKYRVVVDGREDPPYKEIRGLAFSPNGKHYSYATGRRVVMDGRPSSWFQGVRPPVYSPDGRRVAYAFIKDAVWKMNADGRAIGAYKTWPRRVGFSPNSEHFAYVAAPYGLRYDQTVLVLDGKEQELRTDGVGSVLFSPNSERVALVVRLVEKVRVVVDGHIVATHADASEPVFSPDSKHFVCTTHGAIVLDGKRIELPECARPRKPTFSPDSKYVVCVCSSDDNKGQCVTLAGCPGRFYDRILPRYGRVETPSVFFDGPTRFHYFAMRGGKVYRVNEVIFDRSTFVECIGASVSDLVHLMESGLACLVGSRTARALVGALVDPVAQFVLILLEVAERIHLAGEHASAPLILSPTLPASPDTGA